MTFIVGLTGGIGSGKSTVANLFAKHQVPIIDADIIARDLTMTGQPAFHAIVNRLGLDILQNDGGLDRVKLRHIIFQHAEERLWLESLVHPLVLKKIQEQIQLVTSPYCIVVIPLLFEVEPYAFIQRILVVDAPQRTQIERVMARDKADQEKVEAILRAQASRELRLEKADDIIVNDGTLEDLAPQVEKLHKKYLKCT